MFSLNGMYSINLNQKLSPRWSIFWPLYGRESWAYLRNVMQDFEVAVNVIETRGKWIGNKKIREDWNMVLVANTRFI